MINIGLQHTVIFLTVIYQGFYISCQDNPNPSIKHEGYEYTLYSDLKSWTEAEDYCNSTEGHLVVIPNDEINEIVTNLIQGLDEEFVWIGAKRESTIPQWTWVNGSLVGMVGEDFLEPYNCNICNGRYGCGHIETVISAKLVVVEDVTCSTPLRYICQRKECQQNCKIHISNETKSWNDARSACISMGQELAVMPELEPNRMLGSNLQETLRMMLGDDLPNDNIWIGVHRTDWKWINDEYVIYAHNSDLRKKTDNWKNCLSMNEAGNWAPYDCSSSNKFVCSKSDSNTFKTSTEYETTKVTQVTESILMSNMAFQITESEIQVVFKKYDKDNSGSISVAEAHTVLKEELRYNEVNSNVLVKAYDKNKDRSLSYQEFASFYMKFKEIVTDLENAFNEIDVDGSGHISLDEALEAHDRIGINDGDIRNLFHIHDTNNDGKLQFNEFKQLWFN